MTASECLQSHDPKAVSDYYDALQRRGKLGERAFLLLRAHRNTVRLGGYDSEAYLKFLRNRRAHALRELLELMHEGRPLDSYSAIRVMVPKHGGYDEAVFARDCSDEWQSSPKNERIILKFCDELMKEAVAC